MLCICWSVKQIVQDARYVLHSTYILNCVNCYCVTIIT
jgi:hypothetical protein